ncbi:MAG: hypothetical protein ABI873_11885 [Marmoricola sp.]
MTRHSAFWDDLTRGTADPEFEREYAAESRRIAEFDAAINAEVAATDDPRQGGLSVERRRRRSREPGSPRQ